MSFLAEKEVMLCLAWMVTNMPEGISCGPSGGT